MTPHALGRLLLPFALLPACHDRHAPPDPASPPTLAPTPAPDPPIAPDRQCGEAGEHPTDLPPALASGRTVVGDGLLHPGDTLTLGSVVLHYDLAAWHGTHRAGTRGPGLRIEIDRAEVGPHAPWGSLQPLHPDRDHHTFVGPYRIDVHTGPGDPPSQLTLHVTREVCPASALLDPTAASRSLWLSTEAIRVHTYDLHGQLLQLALDARGDAPRLDISNLGYRHWLEPRPGPARSLRVGRHTVTLDRVIPGPGTRYHQTWRADGDARLHVRARIDPAALVTHPAPVPAQSPCGDPTSARTAVPQLLTALPAIRGAHRLDLGQEITLGPIALNYRLRYIPAIGNGPYREEARQIPELQLLSGLHGRTTFPGPSGGPILARLDHQLLRIDPEPGGPPERLRLRRLALTCPEQHVVKDIKSTTYLWLGVLGHTHVILGDPSGPVRLSLQLHLDLRGVSLSFNSAHALLSSPLRPDLIGHAFTFDDHLVEIVDIEASGHTRHDGQRWRTDGLAPLVHVQLAITPQPPT